MVINTLNVKNMKNSNIFKCILLIAVVAIWISSCREKQTDVVIGEIKVFMDNQQVTTGKKGKELQIYIETDAELVRMWPGGRREILQTVKAPKKDSIDIWGNPVLVRSDDYRDYGLWKAAGVAMTVTESDRIGGSGFECKYTFPNAGSYEIYFLATKYGYDTAEDWKRTIKTLSFTVTD